MAIIFYFNRIRKRQKCQRVRNGLTDQKSTPENQFSVSLVGVNEMLVLVIIFFVARRPSSSFHPFPCKRPTTVDDKMNLVAVARCLPGLEQLLIQELECLGIAPVVAKNTIEKNSNKNNTAITTNPIALGGLISFPTTQAELFRCHAQLGIPTSILLRCSTADTTFTAKGLAELRRKVSKMTIWNDLLVAAPEGESPLAMRIHVTSYKSKLYHTQAVAERIEQGIYDAMSLGPVSQDGASALHQDERRPIHVRVTIIRDQVNIFLDTSSYGLPLHQRGGPCSLYAFFPSYKAYNVSFNDLFIYLVRLLLILIILCHSILHPRLQVRNC